MKEFNERERDNSTKNLILCYYVCVLFSGELMIIFEYCKFGNLQTFLVKNRQHFIDQIIAEEDIIDSSITQKQVQQNNGYLLHTK